MSKTALRALDVLSSLTQGAMTATQIANRADVSLSTAVRLMQTLEREGFTRRDDSGRYHAGPRLLSMAHQLVAGNEVQQVASPILRELNRETEQTIHLGSFDGSTLVYIDRFDGIGVLSMRSRVGLAAPLHCTAMGKVVAAFLPQEERQRLTQSITFERYTDNTITSPTEYLQELEKVKRDEYALNLGEHEAVISAIAVPVIESSGHVSYGIDLAVANPVVSNEELLAFLPKLVGAAHEIEGLMGYRSTQPSGGMSAFNVAATFEPRIRQK